MRFEPELLAALIAAAIFVVGLLFLRGRANRTRNVGRPVSGGPTNLRFTCAGCSQQFTHSRRTLGAWEKGTRRFYCNACHTKWLGSRPSQSTQRSGPAGSGAQGPGGRASQSPSSARTPPVKGNRARSDRAASATGCLGVVVVLITLPAVVVIMVSRYA